MPGEVIRHQKLAAGSVVVLVLHGAEAIPCTQPHDYVRSDVDHPLELLRKEPASEAEHVLTSSVADGLCDESGEVELSDVGL